MTHMTKNTMYLDAFISSIEPVLHQMAQVPGSKKKETIHVNWSPSFDVAVHIGISGDIKGNFIICFKNRVSYKLSAAMMGGVPTRDLEKEDVASAVSEFANIAAGIAMVKLEKEGISSYISTPNIFFGKGSSITIPKMEETMVVTFTSAVGEFELNIFITENEDYGDDS